MTRVSTSCSRHTGLLPFMFNICNCGCAAIYASLQSPTSIRTYLRAFAQAVPSAWDPSPPHFCLAVFKDLLYILATVWLLGEAFAGRDLQSPTHLPLFPWEPVYRKFLKRGESLILLTIYHPELQLLQNIKDTYRMNIEGIARWAMKLWKAHVGAEGGRQEV